MRVSELVNTKVSDIDLRRGIISVFGKGSKQRFLPLYGGLTDEIKSYLEIRHNYFIKTKDSGYLFLNRQSEKLTRVYCWMINKKYCKIAKIDKDVSPHTLRHSLQLIS